jgi:hypothetical protein
MHSKRHVSLFILVLFIGRVSESASASCLQLSWDNTYKEEQRETHDNRLGNLTKLPHANEIATQHIAYDICVGDDGIYYPADSPRRIFPWVLNYSQQWEVPGANVNMTSSASKRGSEYSLNWVQIITPGNNLRSIARSRTIVRRAYKFRFDGTTCQLLSASSSNTINLVGGGGGFSITGNRTLSTRNRICNVE